MSDEKSIVAKQFSEWLKDHELDRVIYLFADHKGSVMSEAYDGSDIANMMYNGIPAMKGISEKDLVEDADDYFANLLEVEDPEDKENPMVEDWEAFVEWVNHEL